MIMETNAPRFWNALPILFMLLIFILIAILLSGCHEEPIPNEPRHIDYELAEMVETFRSEAETWNRPTDFRNWIIVLDQSEGFGNIDYSKKIVTVSIDKWNEYADQWPREVILFNQLSYAILNRKPNNEIIMGFVPRSITNENPQLLFEWEEFRYTLVRELFTGK